MKPFATIILIDKPPIYLRDLSRNDSRLIGQFVEALQRNDEDELARTALLYQAEATLDQVISINIYRGTGDDR